MQVDTVCSLTSPTPSVPSNSICRLLTRTRQPLNVNQGYVIGSASYRSHRIASHRITLLPWDHRHIVVEVCPLLCVPYTTPYLPYLPMAPLDETIEQALRSAVFDIFKDDPDSLTVNKARQHVVEDLKLEATYFKDTPRWKDRSKDLIKELAVRTVLADHGTPPPPRRCLACYMKQCCNPLTLVRTNANRTS